jgi:hypothetical protein
VSDSKVCRKCGETKPLPNFNRDSRRLDGRRDECRDCTRSRSAAWREANPEHVKAYSQADAQRRKGYQAEWRAANPDKVKAYRQNQAKADRHDYLTQWRKAHS